MKGRKARIRGRGGNALQAAERLVGERIHVGVHCFHPLAGRQTGACRYERAFVVLVRDDDVLIDDDARIVPDIQDFWL